MQKILDDLVSPEWWFSVVVVAVIVGLIGSYLVRFVDGTGKRVLTVFANRSKAARELHQMRVDYYSANPQLIPFLTSHEVRYRIGVFAMLIMAVVFLVLIVFVAVVTPPNLTSKTVVGVLAAFLSIGCASALFSAVGLLRKASDWMLVVFDVQQALDGGEGVSASADPLNGATA
ncbi:hypothetical protein [Paraburkholderia hospita]|uniref:hypothetical protein n=1 Tax=Paraburkholderia hospita TaxID=169430 RepID=UPI000B347B61|nr:hypothetical protein [Paraburkholderia hospita]OUL71610.1 hypothetical protein CA603_46760 [Paraburkholderia hospita]